MTIGTGSVIVRGYGRRRSGNLIRPVVTLLAPVDINLEGLDRIEGFLQEPPVLEAELDLSERELQLIENDLEAKLRQKRLKGDI